MISNPVDCTMPQANRRKINTKLKLLLIICLVVILIAAAKIFNFQGLLQTSLIWVKSLGSFGPIAFIAIYTLATVLLIPGLIVTLGAGFLYGVVWGSVYVFIAATLGSILAFLIGRYLCRSWVTRQIQGHAKFKAIDQAVGTEGFKIVILTRLSPIFPFNLLNYAFGITQVSLKDYVFGSIGKIPGIVMYVYIGSIGDLVMIGTPHQPTSPETQMAKWVMWVVGFVATVALTVYITRVAKKALDQSVAQGEINRDTTR